MRSPDFGVGNELYGAKGEPFSMSAKASCSRVDCSEPAVTSFEERKFCFDHFCMRSYELLERSHRGVDLAYSSEEFNEELFALDDLARRALEVSFGPHTLDNLDRARLLDILLWAGELTSNLRRRRPGISALERLEGVGAGGSSTARGRNGNRAN